jgi:hypothetical protein
MLRASAILGLAIIVAAPAAAQSATGMGAMQYYVGTWSCSAGMVGQAASTATATYTLDSGVLHAWINVPKQGKMKSVYAFSEATTYDAKNARYVETRLDNLASWGVAYAKPWTGNTETWTDHATSDGKLTRGNTVRVSQNEFTFDNYPSQSATKVDFKGSCHRNS